MKGFLVAAPSSGAGKTTVSAGLIAALRQRGLRVQPFKCGPDFIDTAHHTRLAGRASHNLDTWMLPPEANRKIFAAACHDADVALVEGMMGLFDGIGGEGEEGSSAEIAKLLSLPVVLVLDASAAARSLAAVVHGFQSFDPKVKIVCVVLNRVANAGHAELIAQALRKHDRNLLVGWLPHDGQIEIRERYLGLQTAEEGSWSGERLERLASLVEAHLPLDGLLERCQLQRPSWEAPSARAMEDRPIRIGIARDHAFSFYYEAGLDELRRRGAELVEFSPLSGARLPGNLDALYFGGGYPELYADVLSSNEGLRAELREFAAAGKLIYGECGGLMFLGREVITRDGKRWPMAGLLPLSIQMTDSLVHFGYVDVHFQESGIAPANTRLRGHSFHCSRIVDEGEVRKTTEVHYSLSGLKRREGFASGNVFASYIHLHFAAHPGFAAHFLSLARAASRECEVNR
jgi:cobyrinic acid a,c-diamide synthase